jgi:hypothetical protein
LLTAIGLELSAFFILGRSGFFIGDPTYTTWVVILLIVALHFVLMRWSHGPLMLWLAVVSICWLGLAYLLDFALPALIAGDGLLKVLFGIVMATPLLEIIRPQHQPEVTAE